MKADLHLHSYFSDGVFSPRELVARGKAAGLRAMALTDHDTMGGCEEFAAAAEEAGIVPVRGLEISAYEGAGKVHILGYGCAQNGAYWAYHRLRTQKELGRMREILERANAFYGVHIPFERLEERRAFVSEPYHATHLASLIADVLGRSLGDVFNEALAFGMPAYVPDWGLTPEEGIALIRACGGKAVLAHPGRINLLTPEEYAVLRGGSAEKRRALSAENLRRRQALVERLVPQIDGIECVYSKHSPEEREGYARLARERGLFATGGSDFHADGALSVGCAGYEIGEELLSLLSEGA